MQQKSYNQSQIIAIIEINQNKILRPFLNNQIKTTIWNESTFKNQGLKVMVEFLKLVFRSKILIFRTQIRSCKKQSPIFGHKKTIAFFQNELRFIPNSKMLKKTCWLSISTKEQKNYFFSLFSIAMKRKNSNNRELRGNQELEKEYH